MTVNPKAAIRNERNISKENFNGCLDVSEVCCCCCFCCLITSFLFLTNSIPWQITSPKKNKMPPVNIFVRRGRSFVKRELNFHSLRNMVNELKFYPKLEVSQFVVLCCVFVMGGSYSLLKLLKNYNEETLVTLIKQKSLNINVRDEEDRTALHWAAAEGSFLPLK